MLEPHRPVTHVAPQYQPVLRELAIDAETIFEHPLVKPWRTLDDRENCLLNATLRDGQRIRWHIKRYAAIRGSALPADDEVRGHSALLAEGIPTAVLVGYGKLADRRSFVIFEDLAGYTPADKLLETGIDFQSLLQPTADLAAMLHAHDLHHRDLYLCHFLARIDADSIDLRLIDPARVRRLPGVFTRNRWIVKDLGQFWYSTTKHSISDAQRNAWLARYAAARKLGSIEGLRRKILRKVAWIARHDQRLQKQQPKRNVSIPTPQAPTP
jgi:hypothetical protein